MLSQGGFLGGWIGTSLLDRGEDPTRIRILDLNPPSSHILQKAVLNGVQFIKVDVTDAVALEAAFKAPWKDSVQAEDASPEITVFHTVANIRFYERHASLIDMSARVNIVGTKNIVNAAKAAGANILIYTSSGSVGVRRSRFWLWPWEKEPKHFVQVINDDELLFPKRHETFFSNYAYTKIQADRLVRSADQSPSGNTILRTGCVRPGNGVFGPRGDLLFGASLIRKTNPSWISTIVQSFTYVENCAEAHLCYERRLIELHGGSKNPDIGGQAFCIADPGVTPTYGDIYTTLETLTDGVCFFPSLSPTLMLLVAHIIEFYHVTRHCLIKAGWHTAKLLPAIQGDIINLQPSLFALTQVHLIFDDSRARLSPEKGGLGYQGAWTTLEGIHKVYAEHKQGLGSTRRSEVGGISFGISFTKARNKVNNQVAKQIRVTPIEVLSVN